MCWSWPVRPPTHPQRSPHATALYHTAPPSLEPTPSPQPTPCVGQAKAEKDAAAKVKKEADAKVAAAKAAAAKEEVGLIRALIV